MLGTAGLNSEGRSISSRLFDRFYQAAYRSEQSHTVLPPKFQSTAFRPGYCNPERHPGRSTRQSVHWERDLITCNVWDILLAGTRFNHSPSLKFRVSRCFALSRERRPGSHNGKPSLVVDNTLVRQFDVEVPDKVWVTDITYIKTNEGFAHLAS